MQLLFFIQSAMHTCVYSPAGIPFWIFNELRINTYLQHLYGRLPALCCCRVHFCRSQDARGWRASQVGRARRVLARINEGRRFIVRKWDAAPVEDFLAGTHKWVPRRHFLLQPPDGIANHFFFFFYFDEETLLSEGRRGQRTADGMVESGQQSF
jgi:hypothetical protein